MKEEVSPGRSKTTISKLLNAAEHRIGPNLLSNLTGKRGRRKSNRFADLANVCNHGWWLSGVVRRLRRALRLLTPESPSEDSLSSSTVEDAASPS